MSLSDLIEIKRLDNIAQNIKELDSEVETIVKNLVEKYNTKKQFIELNNLQKKSDRFTSWDYKAAHGHKNLIDKQVNNIINKNNTIKINKIIEIKNSKNNDDTNIKINITRGGKPSREIRISLIRNTH